MNGCIPHNRGARVARWSVFGLVALGLLLALSLLMVGCGGGSSGTETTAPEGGQVTETKAAEEMDVVELADTVVATWTEAVQKLNTLLEGLPDPAAVQPDVEALKEEYIQKFVALGRVKETFDDSDRAQVDSEISSNLMALGDDDFYTIYMANYDEYVYMSGNADFTNLLASFNILAQYSDFTLLKAQEPEEAARLGIE